MKKILPILFGIFILASCNNRPESAFTDGGDVPMKQSSGIISDESIYNLDETFINQDSNTVHLKDFSGKPTVAVMIYTHCTYACPRLTADVKGIEKELGPKAKDVNFVLISFDPENDTPEELKKYREKMMLGDRFTLLHADEDVIRTLSVLLNVQYQKNPDGEFSHSSIVTVLDKEGKVVIQKEGINANQTETINTIRELI